MVNFWLHFWSFLVMLISIVVGLNWPANITLGTISGYILEEATVAAFQEALSSLQANQIVPADINFTYVYAKACDDVLTLAAAINLRYKFKVDAFLGPECSPGAVTAGLFAAIENVPMISDGGTIDTISDKTKYNTFARVSHIAYVMGEAVGNLLIYYNWTTVAIIRGKTSDCGTTLSGVYTFLKTSKIELVLDVFADNVLEYRAALNSLKDTARITVVCYGYSSDSALPFLKEASNMLNSEYVFIIPVTSDPGGTQLWENLATLSKNATLIESLRYYQNSFIVRLEEHSNPKFFNAISEKLKRNVTSTEKTLLMLVHDVMYLYGLALNKTITLGGSYQNGRAVMNSTRLVQFKGASGNVTMNAFADRLPDYAVLGPVGQNNTFAPIMKSFIDLRNGTYNFKYQIVANQKWRTDDGRPPKSVPECGFKNELCPIADFSVRTIAISASLCSLVIICCLLFFFYRKRKNEEYLIYMSWKIGLEEIREVTRQRDLSLMSINENRASLKSYFIKHFVYKGEVVFMKQWKKKTIQIKLSREHFLFLKQLRAVQDNNLNRFLGANFDNGPDVFVIWSYCSKGSLKDILYNDQIQLDMVFKASLIKDIILGLEYLHKSPVDHHGALFIDNCLIGRNWDVKLTNFGMNRLVSVLKASNLIASENENNSDVRTAQRQYHTAPEILRSSCPTSKATDVYSLAIVFYQILFRVKPYSQLDMKHQEILENIIAKNLRPSTESLMPQEQDSNLAIYMSRCWNDNPTFRPNISEIKRNVAMATKKYGKSLMDHVLSVLEKYASNLERLVEERTQQLSEERRKADILLYQMLPRSIVDCLKRGEPVIPESYQLVTLYFSDIVGFTGLCDRSSSMEVVSFLNLLYSGFDHLMSIYDVYKVETIGDAYMVVSGLPQRNGIKHVTEISDMALSVLQFLETFEVPHMPSVKIQCRIGIHSGPVASGVVGLKMPRFCLFGDTVNFASRMESTGLASKIQISQSTATLLNDISMYEVTLRGSIEIKGKGMQTTYWLMRKIV